MQISNASGIDMDKDVVLRIVANHYVASSGGIERSWLTFIGNMKDSGWFIDFF